MRVREKLPNRKPRIYSTLDKPGCGYWVDRFHKKLEVEYAGTFDEAVSIVDGWIREAA